MMNTLNCLLVVLLAVCLQYYTQAAPASTPVTSSENELEADPGVDDLTALSPPRQEEPVAFKADVHADYDDYTASEDLQSLSNPDYYEGYDDREEEDWDDEEDDDDNDEEENDDEYDENDEEEDDFEAEKSLMGGDDALIPAQVFDEDREVNENAVTWRTQKPSTHVEDKDEEEFSPFEKRRHHGRTSAELRQAWRRGHRQRNRWRARGGNREADEPAFPTIRVIELNETLYLNDTDETKPVFQPIAMPESFEDYDVNKNGWISLAELRYVTGASEGVREAFKAADTNGDGRVDREEFNRSMWGAQVDQPPPQGLVLMPAEDLKPSSIPRNADVPKTP